jgi:hypothetical protein
MSLDTTSIYDKAEAYNAAARARRESTPVSDAKAAMGAREFRKAAREVRDELRRGGQNATLKDAENELADRFRKAQEQSRVPSAPAGFTGFPKEQPFVPVNQPLLDNKQANPFGFSSKEENLESPRLAPVPVPASYPGSSGEQLPTGTAGQMLYHNGTSWTVLAAPTGSKPSVLTSTGSTPTWTECEELTVCDGENTSEVYVIPKP